MKKILAIFSSVLLLVPSVQADEGMWMIHRLNEIYPQMRSCGLRMKEREIYNEAEAALSDAVVMIDGGMGTGSMISDKGLLITNHHVAYSDICALSTPANNILETGFWAQSPAEEIPVRGKSVGFLRRVVDVTAETEALIAEMKAAGKWNMMSMRRVYAEMERRYAAQGEGEVSCSSMWGGKYYFMFFYDVYTDVRLVGTPPASIGAFGGDYDNWGWPQHKGDFTLYRVYGDAQGRPAAYAAGNVPLKPRRWLQVSAAGVRDRDYAMVIGYPGRTNRYASSHAIREKQEVRNPVVVSVRHERMSILRRHMERDAEVRMKYSDAFFGLSNFADYAKWENKCFRRFGVADLRRSEEERLQAWIEADPERRAQDGDLLSDLERAYAARRDAERRLNYFREAWLGPSEALLVANRVASYLGRLDRMKRDTLEVGARDAANVVEGDRRLRKDYDAATDRDLLVRMMELFTANVPREYWGRQLEELYDRADGDAGRMAREAFDASFCSDAARYERYMQKDRSVAEIRRDPLVALAESVTVHRFKCGVENAERCCRATIHANERRYAELLYDFRKWQGVAQYPNANSTMRLTYGNVMPLHPSDALHCDARSTVEGYLEKYNPTEYEYRVDERMRDLITRKDWGRWGEKGTLYVNFLTNNDITGGNSGSPVLDGRGRLVGLAFDGNRESMAGDAWFHPELARTVCVDIRFVMWVVEKYAGAGYLLEEIDIVS